MVILVVFVRHSIKRPQIVNSFKQIRRERLKFGLIWLPIMLVMIILQAYCIYLAKGMLDYSSYWLDRLSSVEASYACTFMTLRVDLHYLMKLNSESNEIYLLVTIIADSILILTTIGQFIGHY